MSLSCGFQDLGLQGLGLRGLGQTLSPKPYTLNPKLRELGFRGGLGLIRLGARVQVAGSKLKR